MFDPSCGEKDEKGKAQKEASFVTTLSLPRLRNAVTWQEQNLPEEAAPSVNYDGGKKAVCFNHVISAPSIKMLQQKMLHLQTCQTRIMFLLIIKYYTRSVREKGKRKHSKSGSELWTRILDIRKVHKGTHFTFLMTLNASSPHREGTIAPLATSKCSSASISAPAQYSRNIYTEYSDQDSKI